jgi:hypothetical protein
MFQLDRMQGPKAITTLVAAFLAMLPAVLGTPTPYAVPDSIFRLSASIDVVLPTNYSGSLSMNDRVQWSLGISDITSIVSYADCPGWSVTLSASSSPPTQLSVVMPCSPPTYQISLMTWNSITDFELMVSHA